MSKELSESKKTKLNYLFRIQRSHHLPLNPILNYMNPVHILTFYVYSIYFNIMSLSMSGLPKCISHYSHAACCVLCFIWLP
jgi:hypothetical protein